VAQTFPAPPLRRTYRRKNLGHTPTAARAFSSGGQVV
jgi:hypothetical protein